MKKSPEEKLMDKIWEEAPKWALKMLPFPERESIGNPIIKLGKQGTYISLSINYPLTK